MMKKWGFLLSGGFLLVIILGILLINQRSNQARQQANRVRDSAPTFYLHGYGGSGRSSDSMIAAAEERGRATKVLTAIVSRTGQVELEGHWTDSTTRPIIQVVYKNNRNANYRQNGEWFKRVLIAVNRQHHFKQFNVVAHSMGNLTLGFYLANNAQNKKLPQLAKFVSIAGHYAGIIRMDDRANQNHLAKDGRPQQINATYRQLMGLRHRLPKDQVQFLNVYGDLSDGSDSDGRVSNVSSQSLRYLVAPRAKSYREVEFKGPKAQHSQLHENEAVNKAVIDFLW